MRETVFILHIALNLNPYNKRNHYENYERISKGFDKYKWWILVAIIAQLLKWMMNRKYGNVEILVGRFFRSETIFGCFSKNWNFHYLKIQFMRMKTVKKMRIHKKSKMNKKIGKEQKQNWKETKNPSKILANFFSF